MKDYELILNMIEEADPADTEKLDEIDARVWCYIGEYPWSAHGRMEFISFCEQPIKFIHPDDREYYEGSRKGAHFKRWIRKYWWKIEKTPEEAEELELVEDWVIPSDRFTRSRDILKRKRPPAWSNVTVSIYQGSASAYISNGMIKREIDNIKTEELAELHAIIQAIAWEREHG